MEKTYDEQWEEVAKTEDAHKAIATTYYQNEKYYNLGGITTINQFLKKISDVYGEGCKDLTVLEIGCGTGRETRYLADCFKRVFATDTSKSMIAKGIGRVPAKNVAWVNNESGSLKDIPSNSIDVVYSFIVFQHCKADTVRSYFKEANRVLKHRGRFLFQLGVFERDTEPISYGDVGRRTVKTITKDLIDAGFNIEKLADIHFGLHSCIKPDPLNVV